MGALERLDMMLNDALYGIIFRDINPLRTLIDQNFSRRINAVAGVVINTGEDNYLTTADAVEQAPAVLASQFINERLAQECRPGGLADRPRPRLRDRPGARGRPAPRDRPGAGGARDLPRCAAQVHAADQAHDRQRLPRLPAERALHADLGRDRPVDPPARDADRGAPHAVPARPLARHRAGQDDPAQRAPPRRGDAVPARRPHRPARAGGARRSGAHPRDGRRAGPLRRALGRRVRRHPAAHRRRPRIRRRRQARSRVREPLHGGLDAGPRGERSRDRSPHGPAVRRQEERRRRPDLVHPADREVRRRHRGGQALRREDGNPRALRDPRRGDRPGVHLLRRLRPRDARHRRLDDHGRGGARRGARPREDRRRDRAPLRPPPDRPGLRAGVGRAHRGPRRDLQHEGLRRRLRPRALPRLRRAQPGRAGARRPRSPAGARDAGRRRAGLRDRHAERDPHPPPDRPRRHARGRAPARPRRPHRRRRARRPRARQGAGLRRRLRPRARPRRPSRLSSSRRSRGAGRACPRDASASSCACGWAPSRRTTAAASSTAPSC